MPQFRAVVRVAALATSVAWPGLAGAQQAMDPTFAEHQKAWTTKPEFSSPLVDHLPAGDERCPQPARRARPRHRRAAQLDHYADLLKYYRALAAKIAAGQDHRDRQDRGGPADRRRADLVGRPISRNLEANRANLAKLADPRGLTEAQAHEIIAQTKPMYLALGGLHSRPRPGRRRC